MSHRPGGKVVNPYASRSTTVKNSTSKLPVVSNNTNTAGSGTAGTLTQEPTLPVSSVQRVPIASTCRPSNPYQRASAALPQNVILPSEPKTVNVVVATPKATETAEVAPPVVPPLRPRNYNDASSIIAIPPKSIARPTSWEPPRKLARIHSHDSQATAISSGTSASTSANAPVVQSHPIHNTSSAALPHNSNNTNDKKESQGPELPGEPKLPKEISFDPQSILPIKDDYRLLLTKNAEINQPLLNGWTLYPHQKRAILKGLMKRRLILALDMGLGKTLIGCVWSKAFQRSYPALKVIVICPVSLKGEWKRTAEEATGLAVEEEVTKSKKKAKGVANDGDDESSSLRLSIHSWSKIPTTIPPNARHFVVVCDEAHMMQSMMSARTKSTLKLVKDRRCVGVLLLTGTPMKNGNPSNLFPLLRGVQHPLGRHQRAFEQHFCNGHFADFGQGQVWYANGKTNLKQLHRLIGSNLLHLTKEECLDAMPPMKRETRNVPISARCQSKYVSAVKDLAKLREAMRTNDSLDSNAMLGAFQNLRVQCAFAKVQATVELAKSILETTEPAVVIFTSFAQAAKAIHKQLADLGWEGSLLTGETPPQKRQGLVDNFQNGLSPVFVSTFGAGGVGITLTAACTLISLDRPWTPGEMMQAEDRIRRIGQTKPTRSIRMSAFELDTQVDAMLTEKAHATKAVLADSSIIGAGMSSTGINVDKLLLSLLSGAT